MTGRSSTIKDLCRQWVDASTTPTGEMVIGAQTEQYRLLRNGIAFHDLDHEELRASCLGLSTVLLRPGLNTVIDADHQGFWSWCGEVLLGTPGYFTQDERELHTLFGLVVRASLADSRATPGVEHNALELMRSSHRVMAYLAFPLLEGILKKACAGFVGLDGNVATTFTVKRTNGGPRTYQVGGRCSSLADLLRLLSAQVAGAELRADLDEQKAHLAVFANGNEDGFDVIYRWRNSSLHGTTSFPTIGGTVFNTAILVALDGVRNDYTALHHAAVQAAQRAVAMGTRSGGSSRSPWSYYPPYFEQ